MAARQKKLPVKVAKALPTATCVFCHKTVKIRISGKPDEVGRLHRHGGGDPESGEEGWMCPGGGDYPYGFNLTPGATGHPYDPRAKYRPVNQEAPSPFQALVDELTGWWMATARTETEMVCHKAIEYGATDLRDLGRHVYEMAGRDMPSDGTATEAGIAFYVAGKLSRVVAAIREGRNPSRDTWLDIGVYARMAQRVHDTGGWPGITGDPSWVDPHDALRYE